LILASKAIAIAATTTSDSINENEFGWVTIMSTISLHPSSLAHSHFGE
jgi:hypothetical protein